MSHTLRLVGQGNFAAALQTKTSRLIIGGTLIAASFMTGGAAGIISGAIFGGVLDYGMQVVQNVFDPQVNGLDVFTHINAGQVMNSMFLGAVGGAVGELATLGGTALFGKGIQASFGKVFGLEMAGNVAGDMAMNVVAGQPAFQGFDNPWQWGMNLATSGFAAHVRVRGYQAEQVIAARLKTVSGVPVEGRNLDSLSLMKERMAGTRETGTPIRDRLAARNRSMNTTTIADASQGGHHVTLSADALRARGLTDAQVAEFQQFGHMMGGAGPSSLNSPLSPPSITSSMQPSYPIKWNPKLGRAHEGRWQATADFKFHGKDIKSGSVVNDEPALEGLVALISKTAGSDYNLVMAYSKLIGAGISTPDYFKHFSGAWFDFGSSNPQWIYASLSGRVEVRNKLQLAFAVNKRTKIPENQLRVTIKFDPDWTQPEWTFYKPLFEHIFTKTGKSNAQLNYGYSFTKHGITNWYLNLAYGLPAQNRYAHLVSLSSIAEFATTSRAQLPSADVPAFNNKLLSYLTPFGGPNKFGVSIP
ncbi:MAG: hypothetical protein ACOYYS_16865 [Chloroflexota bacterium]